MRDAKEKMEVLRALKQTIMHMKYFGDIETLALDTVHEKVILQTSQSSKIIDVRDLNSLGICKKVLDNL